MSWFVCSCRPDQLRRDTHTPEYYRWLKPLPIPKEGKLSEAVRHAGMFVSSDPQPYFPSRVMLMI